MENFKYKYKKGDKFEYNTLRVDVLATERGYYMLMYPNTGAPFCMDIKGAECFLDGMKLIIE